MVVLIFSDAKSLHWLRTTRSCCSQRHITLRAPIIPLLTSVCVLVEEPVKERILSKNIQTTLGSFPRKLHSEGTDKT
ncbi:hypothetical protein DTO013E5_5367 [Penicillium roqueforti]|uniref:uncharacterized protein n=1 Tax=Penicillium roqueforti TaxID=5082 RepID=UPI00190D907D|nr:uncharacterized protein LCP9604111_3513 [Penicillium roqueforti]KAF9250611.1 hypothetical protein LCP9604111_3513 [Penicillium roqueforti]KAI1830011.1 hypothetical protein CBS147337_9235 [Penicillium roqueforti]KAI2672608.1 hypothetical protein CBS147355_7935 [Penicillium roqueforti]KAI2678916.1 hypothetical protein LCP963914a_7495 [Penicillium roqueforti]KAI2698950.1 hypothetical protein CBS147372_6797 [Penicillium roqueforti]